MRILIAPDSFKGSLTATEVAQTIAEGLAEVLPDAAFDLVPMADGGEGTVEAIVNAVGGELVQCEVTGPLGVKRNASYGLIDDGATAVLEMAEASGIILIPEAERDPLKTTSFGGGEMIADALGRGVEQIVMGIGGSATNDGGVGMAQALGAKFYTEDDREIAAPFAGGQLAELNRVDLSKLDSRLRAVRVRVACDVDNPLLGPTGATAVFGPQKGASAANLALLEAGMKHAYDRIEMSVGKSVRDIPGSGAAGGMGAALLALLGAELETGVELVAGLVRLDARVADKDLVITGEGALDSQTTHGKAPAGVAKVAKRHGVPVIAIGGMLDDSADLLFDYGFDGIEGSVVRPCSGSEALANARQNLLLAARRVGRWLQFAKGFNRPD